MAEARYHQPRRYPAASLPLEAAPVPVVVVGAGPVGLTTALGLVRRGVPVTVLEAGDSPSFGSRAVCVSRHSLEVLERLDVAGAVEAVALPWTGGRSFFRDTEVLSFQMPTAAHDVRAPMVNISQSELEQILVDALNAHPLATLAWGVEVTGFRDDASAVTLTVNTHEGARSVRAQWVVACDGAHSRMREAAGLTLKGTSYEGRYVLADIHWPVEDPVERRVWFDPPSNPGSTVLMHRQPHDVWRIDYQLAPDADIEVESDVVRITERVERHLSWLGNGTPWSLQWHSTYSAHARALDEFVHGRVVFAGDAAHLVPIFGVRGLNSGLEDAETLAWILAAVVDGRAEPTLLQAYSRERRSAWEQNVANARKSVRLMTPGSHGYTATRDAILRLSADFPAYGFLLNPRQASATHAHSSPLTWHAGPGARGSLPGDPIADWRLDDATLNTLRGNGFGLLAFGFDAAMHAALTPAATRLADALAPEPCQVVMVNGSVERDTHASVRDDDLQRALGARDGEVFVVRPDGLLMARLTTPDELDQVAEAVHSGCAPADGHAAPEWPDVSPPQERHLEHLWLTLSAALDETAPEEREDMLTRLVFLLGTQVSVNRLTSAVKSAVEKGKDVV